MSNYITIILKEDIKYLPDWIAFVMFAILAAIVIIPTIISWVIVEKKHKPWINVIRTEVISGAVAIIGAIIFAFTILPHMLEPSGKYTYKATVDKNKITVSEYEDFIEQYKPEIRDGYYYFEAEDIEK